jgi:hypothetical protein
MKYYTRLYIQTRKDELNLKKLDSTFDNMLKIYKNSRWLIKNRNLEKRKLGNFLYNMKTWFFIIFAYPKTGRFVTDSLLLETYLDCKKNLEIIKSKKDTLDYVLDILEKYKNNEIVCKEIWESQLKKERKMNDDTA